MLHEVRGQRESELFDLAQRFIARDRIHRVAQRVGRQQQLVVAFREGLFDVPLDVDGDDEMVPATSIQPIGLITNELVTNAAKHGAGKIDVAFRASAGINRLIVCDEGTGLDDGFDPHSATAGLGMRVITTLVKQLRGTLDAGPRADADGACFTVQFPREG